MPEEWANKKDPLLWVTTEYTKAIETFVREDPTQYWWLHEGGNIGRRAKRLFLIYDFLFMI